MARHTIAGKYTIVRRIAAGGMAEVFLARLQGPEGFQKHVVIKQILPHLAKNERFVRMFLDEARVAADLSHPNVVHLYEVGEDAGTYYLVMEYLHGQTVRALHKVLRDHGQRLPLPLALRIVIDAAKGLHYAHKKKSMAGEPLGIVHRDVSPSNIMVTFEGTTKIVDFGIAAAHINTRDTDPGTVKGKFGYMSPEQAMGKPMDPRSDQFSLGIVLWELTTGRRLFTGRNDAEILEKLRSQAITPPSVVDASYPVALEKIVLKTLAQQPANRFDDCQTLANKLEGFVRVEGLQASSDQLGEWLRQLFADDLRAEAMRRIDEMPTRTQTPTTAPPRATISGAPLHRAALVFTDIESSTALWDHDPRSMQAAMDMHDTILRTHLAEFDGYEVQNRGDAFKLAFHSPQDAVRYCFRIQLELLNAEWPKALLEDTLAGIVRGEGGEPLQRGLRVRMGVHWCEPEAYVDPTTGRMDYAGPEVNRASRVAQAAYGGQILLSAATWDALKDDETLTDSAITVDLGAHQLRGIDSPERLVQILPRSIERQFPAPRVEHAPRTNLTPDVTPFIGRTSDLEALETATQRSRLVTILGLGGIGKTRLARRFARQQLQDPQASAWFCDLAEARTLEGVCMALANALGIALVSDKSSEQFVEIIGHALTARSQCLIVLDHFEHIIDLAERTVARWLELAPNARFLVTSRQKLNLDGEVVHELGPLGLPESPERATESEAVQLFMERARSVAPDLQIDDQTAPAVSRIVTQLDGLPLAIELAAARMNVFTPRQLADRLHERFKLLRGRSGDGSQGLRATIDWSWELLTEPEQLALAQCSVFRDGFFMDAAEAVLEVSAVDPDVWPVDLLQSLREKSLITTRPSKALPNETRFHLFESILVYAAEKLDALGAVEPTQERHTSYYVRLCDELAEQTSGPQGREASRRLAAEMDNLVAAQRRITAAKQLTEAQANTALRAACALRPVFSIRGPFATHLTLLDEALDAAARTGGVDRELRARVLMDRARAQMRRSAYDLATADLEQAWELAGEGRVIGARVTALRGSVHMAQGRFDEAEQAYTEALEMCRATHDTHGEAEALGSLGILRHDQGELERAADLYQQGLQLFARLGDRRSEGIFLSNLAVLHQDAGRFVDARVYHRRALPIHLEMGNRRAEALTLGSLAALYHEEGRLPEAHTYYAMSLAILREVGHERKLAHGLTYRALLYAEEHRFDDARRDILSAASILDNTGSSRLRALASSVEALIVCLSGSGAEAATLLDQAEPALPPDVDPTGHAVVQVGRALVEVTETDDSAARQHILSDTVEQTRDTASRSDMVRLALRLLRRET